MSNPPMKVVPMASRKGLSPIEPGVPIPERKTKNPFYPFGKMKVGESFTAPIEWRNAVSVAAHTYGSRNKMKFKTRTEGTRVRIWRVK